VNPPIWYKNRSRHGQADELGSTRTDTVVLMKTRFPAQIAALMLSLQIGGCASIQSHWPFKSQLPPTTAATSNFVYRQTPPPATASERPKKVEHETARTTAPQKAPATASVPTRPPNPPTQATYVTLEDNDADHLQAQALLDDADSRLAQIDRSKLTAENAAAYDQASDLAKAAHNAMVQHDYLAASGLARKATLVTAQVASRNSSR
jgi:hypothetical protein